jgi:hypothetical protein
VSVTRPRESTLTWNVPMDADVAQRVRNAGRVADRLAAGGEDAVDERIRPAAVGIARVRRDAVAARRGEVEALVEQISAGEPGAHEVPGEPEQGRPRLGVDTVGAVEELVEQRAERRVVELATARRGQEVVAADERDDLGDPREPLGEQ